MEKQPMTANSAVMSFDRLVETHGLLWRLLNDDLERALGLPLQWYGVLRRLGQSADGLCSMSQLTAVTTFTSGGVTRLVDRMEQAGYVERLPCPKDRRVHYEGLTDHGRALLHHATDVHQQGLTERITNVLEHHEIVQLDAMLAKLLASASGRV